MSRSQRASDAPRFTEGDMSRHVIRLSGFMVIGFLAMTTAQLIEAIYLGIVGRDELAAIAFTFPVVMALSAMTRGIGVGTGAVLARAMGGRDRPLAKRLTSHGLLLVVVFNIATALLLARFGGPLFALLGAEGHILDLVLSYVHVWCIGFPFFGLTMVGSGLMRSIGDPKFPGLVMTAGSILQVAIGPVLIFGWFGLPALGIEGAGWAFVAARLTSFLMAAYWFFFKEQMIGFSFDEFADSARAILHVGVPATASNLVQPISMAVTTWLMAGFSTSVVAGFGVASRIESIVHMVIIGIASSTGPLVGQNWGARKFDRARQALRICYQYCFVWSAIGASIMWLGGAYFVSLINDDPGVVATATRFLYIVPITLGFEGMLGVATGAFNALSNPLPPLVLSIVRVMVLYVPMAIWASRHYGPTGVFVATALANAAVGLAAGHWNRRSMAERERRANALGAAESVA